MAEQPAPCPDCAAHDANWSYIARLWLARCRMSPHPDEEHRRPNVRVGAELAAALDQVARAEQ